MEIKQVKALARERIANARFDAKKLALIFTGATVLLSLAVSLISFLLDQQMDGAVGLAGLGTRAALSLVQSLVMMASLVVTPFWNLGYVRATLDTARDGSAEPRTLLSGFGRIFPAVRLYLLRTLLITVVIFGSTQIGMTLFMFTPASEAAMTTMDSLLAAGETALMDEAVAGQLIKLFWPMYVLAGAAALTLLIPLLYRLRLVEFSLMDGQDRAIKNMLTSNLHMRGHCVWMFKLDVSFWWYFLLQGLTAVVAYGDIILGIETDVAYWVCVLASAILQLVLGWKFLPYVQTTYALAYDEITKNGQA